MADATDGGAGGEVAEAPQGAAARMSNEELSAEVKRCKAVLDGKDSPPTEDVLAALMALKQMGPLPTKLLSETLIGKSVNTVAKGGGGEAVSKMAKELVEMWRQEHRKRKAASEGGNPELKRGKSSTLSLGGSEAPASQDKMAASQESAQPARAHSADASQADAVTRAVMRTDSLLSMGSTLEESTPASQDVAEGQEEVAPYRGKVRQKLLEALGKAEEIEAKDGRTGDEEEMRDPVKLADEIDQELHKAFPKKEEYMAQARSILFNLKDKKNLSFKFKIMVGFYTPSQVPKLGAEEMASDEKNQERAAQRKYAMEEIQGDWDQKNGQQHFTGMFTCGKCKGTKTTYFQLQTRSSDEPMTTFVTCATCGNRWKFC